MEMITQSKVARWGSIAIVLLFAGCTVDPIVEIYNATSDTVEIMVDGARYRIDRASRRSFDYPTRREAFGELGACLEQRSV